MQSNLVKALKQTVNGETLRKSATNLFGALGYASDRTLKTESVMTFLEELDAKKKLSEKQYELLSSWCKAEIIFQITEDEIPARNINSSSSKEFEESRSQSLLFVAAELNDESYSRTVLSDTTRAVNRLFNMPTIVLYRYGTSLTLGVIHRRAQKLDDSQDVLEKVSLIKDIQANNPHRAHVNILSDFTLPQLEKKEKIHNFDKLYEAIERTLDVEELNQQFYKELFEWFELATKKCVFPNSEAGKVSKKVSNEQHVIRLITRLLFIWFLKEKELVPEELFDESFCSKKVLKQYDPDSSDYYCSVLQNLFFATLNNEIKKRSYSNNKEDTEEDLRKYKYKSLLKDPRDFLRLLETVPFVNGGLFECLDSVITNKKGGGGKKIY